MRVISSTALLAVAAAAVHALPINYPPGSEQGSPPAPATTAAPSPAAVKRAVDQLTIILTNQHSAAITTRHAIEPGVPKPVDPQQKEVKEGKIEKGAKGVYIVSPNYIGSVFVNDAKFPASQHCTQIEVSMKQGKKGFDISNVTGFTLPIICGCEAADGSIYESGCGHDLVGDAKKDPAKACKNWIQSENACANPNRDNTKASGKFVPAPFFEACARESYTYVDDHDANRWDLCKKNTLSCCVGPSCPKRVPYRPKGSPSAPVPSAPPGARPKDGSPNAPGPGAPPVPGAPPAPAPPAPANPKTPPPPPSPPAPGRPEGKKAKGRKSPKGPKGPKI
ncbi:hypothetical protein RB597_002685 [Gaeumannomyces tritici]